MSVLEIDQWELARAPAGSIDDPAALAASDVEWTAASVPGTVAGALRSAGTWSDDDILDFDGFDWWFRTSFQSVDARTAALRFGGIATIADVWINGRHVLRSDNMFVEHVIESPMRDCNDVVVCCRSLREHLAVRRPRPRWKTRLVELQQLRWVRTTLLGRIPSWTPPAPPVGLWRPVEVVRDDGPRVQITRLTTRHDGASGELDFAARVEGVALGESARLTVGDAVADLVVDGRDDAWQVSATLTAPGAAAWFPATHGEPVLHAASLRIEAGGQSYEVPLGGVGYRTVAVEDADGGFALSINGVPVFCRGACWVPPDVIGLNAETSELRRTLEYVRAAGMNMVRVAGTLVYEQDDFYRLCDELGILVWQDFMFANMDYPVDDESFANNVATEVTQVLARLRRHPSVVVLCGGSEVEQQAAMMGIASETFTNPLGREVLANLALQEMPDAAYVQCSPSGGVFPFSTGTGVTHYYGVGAYLRPLTDARRAGVRFASECLAFANVPTRECVEELLRDGEQPGHSPRWKARVPRDRGAGWDFEDVRDHYVRAFFGCDPVEVRYADPERYLDLGRAAVHIAIESTLSEWRRPGSKCAGALVFLLRDLWAGAGWGVLDHAGRPKSAYDAMARACSPVAVLLSDEGLDGLVAHVVNDRPTPFAGSLHVRAFGIDGSLIASAEDDVVVSARGAEVRSIDQMMGAFRDWTHAYRFGPLQYDVVSVQLRIGDEIVSEAHYLPAGHGRPRIPELGLRATGRVVGDDVEVLVESAGFAHFVSLEIPGHTLDENWFHLNPGEHRRVLARPTRNVRLLAGEVDALNAVHAESVHFMKDSES